MIASHSWFEEGSPDTDVIQIDLSGEKSIWLEQTLELAPESVLIEPQAGEDILAAGADNIEQTLDALEILLNSIKR